MNTLRIPYIRSFAVNISTLLVLLLKNFTATGVMRD
jgi:hypothetical protein